MARIESLSGKKRSLKKNRIIRTIQCISVKATVLFSLSVSSLLLLSSSPFPFLVWFTLAELHHSVCPLLPFQTSVRHILKKDNTIAFMNLAVNIMMGMYTLWNGFILASSSSSRSTCEFTSYELQCVFVLAKILVEIQVHVML